MLWGKTTQVGVSWAGFSGWSSFDRRKLRRANKGLERDAARLTDMSQVCDGEFLRHVSNTLSRDCCSGASTVCRMPRYSALACPFLPGFF